MAISAVSGVFSRYFVVGFYLPSLLSLLSLWLLASSTWEPDVFLDQSEATQVLIIGAISIWIGLALSGLNYQLYRLYEGYPFEGRETWPLVEVVAGPAYAAQRRRYTKLESLRSAATPSRARTLAAWDLDRYFPRRQDAVLPTRFGNAIRAFEHHSMKRWGLDGVAIWPLVESLISDHEVELHEGAKGDVAFFVNLSATLWLVGLIFAVDASVNQGGASPYWLLALAVGGYLAYRASVGAAVRWGAQVRASIDLHRLDLYQRVGIRVPASALEERATARALNRCLAFGEVLPNDVRSTPTRDGR